MKTVDHSLADLSERKAAQYRFGLHNPLVSIRATLKTPCQLGTKHKNVGLLDPRSKGP